MKLLETVNAHPRDPNLEFDEKSHRYQVDNVIYNSVTSLINTLFPEFDKKKSITMMMNGKNWGNHELFGKTMQEIEEIWSTRNKKAMNDGVILHEDIENFLNKIAVDNTSKEFQYFQNFVQEHSLKVFRTEWKIYHEDYQLAGTIDMCSMNADGTMNLYDWKRSKSIRRFNNFQYSTLNGLEHIMDTNFNHYALQLNFYKYILESKYNYQVRNMYIVCLHPDNKNNDYLIYSIPSMDKDITVILNSLKNNK
jgi:hypothetical protein